MCQSTDISQTAGFGSRDNTFIAEQHNHTGLSVSDAAQMALAIFREYFPQLREELLKDLHKLVEEELKTVPPANIVPPSPRIAVPTLQNASITEEPEIRVLYAKLLASSMNNVVKNGVHPGFVEIIKQLCPDEAKVLRYLSTRSAAPTITLRYVNEKNEGRDIIKNFSNIGELASCESPYDINKYFNNLIRLGLLEKAPALSVLTGKTLYEPLKNHKHILPYVKAAGRQKDEYNKIEFEESFVSITDYGKTFCKICLFNAITIEIKPLDCQNQGDAP